MRRAHQVILTFHMWNQLMNSGNERAPVWSMGRSESESALHPDDGPICSGSPAELDGWMAFLKEFGQGFAFVELELGHVGEFGVDE